MSVPEILSNEGWIIKKTLSGQLYGFNSQTLAKTEAYDNIHLVQAGIIKLRFQPNKLDENRIYLIDISLIEDNPWQTRQNLDKEHIKALAEDIRTRGLMQPPMGRIVIDGQIRDWDPQVEVQDLSPFFRLRGANIQLAFGHNRVEAYKLLAKTDDKYKLIPIQIRGLTDQAMANMAWSENSARKDLSSIEEALAIQKRCQDFSWNQTQVADELGLSASAVSNKLRLLRLPEDIKEQIRAGELSERQAMALIPLYDLPPSALERGEKLWYGPSQLKLSAPTMSSKDIREKVKRIIDEVAAPLHGEIFPTEQAFAEDERFNSSVCTICQFFRKKDKKCFDETCRLSKRAVWADLIITQAEEQTGLKRAPEQCSWEEIRRLTNEGKDYANQIVDFDNPCPNLRLYVTGVRHTPLLEILPQVDALCYHRGQECACLASAVKEAKQKEREKERERKENDPEEQKKARKKKQVESILSMAQEQVSMELHIGNHILWLEVLHALHHPYRGKGENWTTEQIFQKIAHFLVRYRSDYYQEGNPESAQNSINRFLVKAGMKKIDLPD